MPLRPSRRLPKKYSRRISDDTRRFVSRRRERKKKLSRERWKRILRRMQRAGDTLRISALRWGIVSGIALVLLLVGLAIFSPALQVREINITRLTPRLDIEQVQTTLSPMFGRHLLFVSSFDVSSLLNENIADVDTVTIGKQYPSILDVSISLHPIVARLHIDEPDSVGVGTLGTGTVVDFLTDQGVYVVTLAAQDTEVLPLIRVVDWGVRPQPGDMLLQPQFIERMESAEVELLRQFGQETRGRTAFVRAQEFHLHLDDFVIWFDMKSPLEEQLQRYRTFLRSVDVADVHEYVDLRIAERVIYK